MTKKSTSPNSTVPSDPYDPKKRVCIDYTNYKGERGVRVIVPTAFGWKKTEFHPTEQWMVAAYDVNKCEERIFAMKDIHSWEPVK